jgi:hypothetical protein
MIAVCFKRFKPCGKKKKDTNIVGISEEKEREKKEELDLFFFFNGQIVVMYF